jgi:hypothetical protein
MVHLGDYFGSHRWSWFILRGLCRRINPDWPKASALTRNLEQAINGTKYQEPTQEMVSLDLLPPWRRAQPQF